MENCPEKLYPTQKMETNLPRFHIANHNSATSNRYHFMINQQIAQGGMGRIFKGTQNSLQREIALKTILAKNIDDKQKDRFIVEAKITASLDHPNIVSVYDLGICNDGPVLVMKLIQGNSWKNLIDQYHKDNSPDLETHLRILLNVCNAVAYAHHKNILHNDLKPSNIMVGKFGEVTVMDWGIAVDYGKQKSDLVTHKSEITKPMGTPCYISPEMAEGNGTLLGPWSDVYLLGGILYKILTGKTPHSGANVYQILYDLFEGVMPSFPDDIPDELANICRKALAIQVADRYQNVEEFSNAIETFLRHRESIIITNEAQKTLEACEKESAMQRYQLYENYSESIAGFRQAIKLWGDNHKAREGEQQACLQYAHAAVENNDFGLAKSQAEKLQDTHQKQQLLGDINTIQEQQRLSSIAQRLSKVAMFFVSLFCFRFVLVAMFTLSEKQYTFFRNDFQQIIICGLLLAISYLCYRIFSQTQPTRKQLINTAILYEMTCVFLVSLFFSHFPFAENSTTGIFPSVVAIIIFRLAVPYHKKTVVFIGLASATVGALTFIIAKDLFLGGVPLSIKIPFIIQHYVTVIIGVMIANQLNVNDNHTVDTLI